MRPAPTASCLKTPLSSPMESPRDDTFTSLVRIVLPLTGTGWKKYRTWLFVSYFCLLSSGFSFKARTGTLEPSELETFKKQAECLNFLPEYHFGGTGQISFSFVPNHPSNHNFVPPSSPIDIFLLFQNCVQITGSPLCLLRRVQGIIKPTLSLLQSKPQQRDVVTLWTASTHPNSSA